jgi:hypothetical protein
MKSDFVLRSFCGHWVPRVALVAVWASMAGCYLAHSPESGSLDGGRDAGRVDAGVFDAGRPCGCPGREVVCRLPEMCCPATETCENPASFSCTGFGDPCE